MKTEQNYSNHVRWYPIVHFVLTPILLFNLIWQIVRLSQEFSWDRAESVLLAAGLMILSLTARIQALKALDRVIRLEERLRYRELLPKDVAEKAASLRTRQIIALRFASDEELPELISQVLDGKLNTPKEIKMAVKNWRGDYLRV
ncbi:MAG: hypothetical protein KF855_10365 [Acidobacteria bacterium]|nr:hypothetical protein [Acidobacteriota bacterium]